MTKISINLKSNLVANVLVEYLNKIFGAVCSCGYQTDCDYLITEDDMVTYNIAPSNLVILTDIQNLTHYSSEVSLIYYPLNIRQLVSLVNVLINRNQNTLTVAHLKLVYSFNTGQIIDDKAGRAVKLTAKETLLLQSLFMAYPQAISKEELLQKIWYVENKDIETFTLESHVSFLRKKLTSNFLNVVIIKDNRGYRLELKQDNP